MLIGKESSTENNSIKKGKKQFVSIKEKNNSDNIIITNGKSQNSKISITKKKDYTKSTIFDYNAEPEKVDIKHKKKNDLNNKSSIQFNILDNKREKPTNPNRNFIPQYEINTPFKRKLKEFYSENYDNYKEDYNHNATTGTLKNEFKKENETQRKILQDPSLTYKERKMYSENPKMNLTQIKDTIKNTLNLEIDNKRDSIVSNNPHKKREISSFVENSRFNTTRNTTRNSRENLNLNKIDNMKYVLKPKSKNIEVNKNASNRIKSEKLRWIDGIDWKTENTEMIFGKIPKIDDNYDRKQKKLKDYQSNLTDYDVKKQDNEKYNKMNNLESFDKINLKDREEIYKSIGGKTNILDINQQKQGKINEINSKISIFQGKDFFANVYNKDKNEVSKFKFTYFKLIVNRMKLT